MTAGVYAADKFSLIRYTNMQLSQNQFAFMLIIEYSDSEGALVLIQSCKGKTDYRWYLKSNWDI